MTPVAEPVEARATDPFDKLRDRELRENSGTGGSGAGGSGTGVSDSAKK